MSEPLLLRRAEVIDRLMERGLRCRQARIVLARRLIPTADHRLHSQARWWRAEVDRFDVLAFLAGLPQTAAGKQIVNSTGPAGMTPPPVSL